MALITLIVVLNTHTHPHYERLQLPKQIPAGLQLTNTRGQQLCTHGDERLETLYLDLLFLFFLPILYLV